MADITLNDSGPSPNPYSGKSGSTVSFLNNMSIDATITCDEGLLIFDNNASSLSLSKNGGTGSARVGAAAKSGKKFYYQSPSSGQDARNGTINISS